MTSNMPDKTDSGLGLMRNIRREDINFRPITQGDMAFLRDLYASGRRDELAAAPWPEEQKRAFLNQQFDLQHAHYQRYFPAAWFEIVQHGTRPIGRRYLERMPSEYRLIDIALIEDYRNRGVGTALMREVLDKAASEGVAVRIHVEKFNPALRLYQRLGFREIGDEDVYLFMEWTPAAV